MNEEKITNEITQTAPQSDVQKIIQNLNKETQDFVSDFIKTGYKKTLAKLLVSIGRKNAEKTLSELPPELACELKTHLASDEFKNAKPSDPEIAVESAFILKDFPKEKLDAATEKLKEISFTDRTVETQCEEIFKTNPFLSIRLQEFFTFEDLPMLDDRATQKVLREVEQQELAIALKNASENVQDKIFSNMSRRAAEMLKEDMEFMGPVRLVDVVEAQKKIVEIIRRLEDAGEIVIARPPSEDELVS